MKPLAVINEKKIQMEGIKGFKKKSKGSERYLAPAILHNKSTP
jgi:hypothetical protein